MFYLLIDFKNLIEILINSENFTKLINLIKNLLNNQNQDHNNDIIKIGIHFFSRISPKLNNSDDIDDIVEIFSFYFDQIYNTNNDMFTEIILYGLANISIKNEYKINFSILSQNKIFKYILNLDLSTDLQIIKFTIRIISNFLDQSEFIIDELINQNLIKFLLTHLNSRYNQIRKEAIWCFSNLATRERRHIEIIINNKLIDKISNFICDKDYFVVQDSLYTLTNCISNQNTDYRIIMRLIEDCEIMNYLMVAAEYHFNLKNIDLLVMVLEAILMIIQTGDIIINVNMNGDVGNPLKEKFLNIGGLNFMENIQYYENEEVYKISTYIIEICSNNNL